MKLLLEMRMETALLRHLHSDHPRYGTSAMDVDTMDDRAGFGNGNKPCFKCGETKPRSEFYRHAMMADGLLGKCKDCTKADQRAHYRTNIDRYKEYERSRAMLPHRVALRSAYQQTEAGKDALLRGRKAYIARNPEKRRAHIDLGNAVRDGWIIKPTACEWCGTECSAKRSLHGHHADYGKPLDVVWLCGTCHRNEHRAP